MALANIACLLAQRDENESTLMIDWDLEAPGLHRYFQNQISSNSNRVSSLEVQSGLIDFFYEVTKLCTRKNLSDDDISSKVFDEVGIEMQRPAHAGIHERFAGIGRSHDHAFDRDRAQPQEQHGAQAREQSFHTAILAAAGAV